MLILLLHTVVAVHWCLLAFLLTGGFLALRWKWVFLPHAAIVVWGVITSIASIACPLTLLENVLRGAVGLPRLDADFIETYVVSLGRVVGGINHLRLLTFAVIALSWLLLGVASRRRTVARRRAEAVRSATAGSELAAASATPR